MPDSSVRAVCQTDDKYIWVGTRDGLARFDGIRFSPQTENVGISGRWVTFLFESRDHTLWIGTDGGGIVRINAGTVTTLQRAQGLASDFVRSICETKDGTIWIGTGTGLTRWKEGSATNFTMANGLPNDVIRAVCEDMDGNLWVGTGEGLVCMRDSKVVAVHKFDPNAKNGFPHNSIRALYVDKAGGLCIGSNIGFSYFKDGVFTNYFQTDGLLDGNVATIFQDSHGQYWIGTYGGINRWVDGKIIPFEDGNEPFSEMVYCFTEDHEGNVWAGTKAGLVRLTPQRFSSVTRSDGLVHNSTVSVAKDSDGSLWLGTWGGGIDQLKGSEWIRHPSSEVLPFKMALALCPTRDGNLWFGADYNGGLFYRDNGGRIMRWGTEHGMRDPAISVIYEDKDGKIWAGTRSALVLCNSGSFTRYTVTNGLPSDSIRVIAERNGNLVVGTTAGLATKVGESFRIEPAFQNINVTALYPDGDSMWVGTKGRGIARMIGGNTEFFTTTNGLAFDEALELIEDDGGFLWASCSRGIFRVRKSDFSRLSRGEIEHLNSIAYDKSDGMISIDCKGVAKPGACKAADGRLWFPTDKGFVVVDPRLPINQSPPRVVVEKIIADRKFVARGNNIQIPPGRGELEIHFTALSYVAPEKNRFRYELKSVDSGWVDVKQRRVAYYNNLKPGRFTFRVIACNNDGVWNEQGVTLEFILRPQFWQTAWFKFGIAAGVIGMFALVCQIRASRLREIEKLRVRIAADLHDEVGSSLWSISLLSGILEKNQSKDPELKQDLAEINRIANQTASAVRDIVWFIKPEYNTVQDLLLRMRDAADVILGSIDYRLEHKDVLLTRKLSVDFRQHVFLMCKEILTNIAKHAEASCVEISIAEKRREWILSVRDNGKGFSVEKEFSGNGLKNLRLRCEKIRAKFHIVSRPGEGTLINITIPL